MKQLNTGTISSVVIEANEDIQALEEVQLALHSAPRDQNLQQLERDKYKKFKKSSYMEEVFLQQRSKATWPRLGDNDTNFFSVIKYRRLQQL